MNFTTEELATYSQEQIDILTYKVDHTYSELKARFNITSSQRVSHWLERTLLGFRVESINAIKSGPIPLIPDVVTTKFIEICNSAALELNCIYTHKAISYLEQALADRVHRIYQLCTLLRDPIIYEKIEERLSSTSLSSQWFHHYCEVNGLKLVNSQNLEHMRRKYCHENVMIQFYAMLARTIHQIPELLLNADETSFVTTKKGKIVVPEGKFPLVDSDVMMGHITTVCTCSASGYAFPPFIILPLLTTLPYELREFYPEATFGGGASGWMTSKLFYCWTLSFIAELQRRRIGLTQKYGIGVLTHPAFLILDGHKSRINADALMLLAANHVRVIVLPAHSSHITQPFDVALAAPFKAYLRRAKDSIPQCIRDKIQHLNPTAQRRYIAVLNIIDSWKRAATISNISSAWAKAGIYPLNVDKVLQSPYVRKFLPEDVIAPEAQRNSITINAMELTTPEKLLEIARHCTKNPNLAFLPQLPDYKDMIPYMTSGHEKLLSSVGYIPYHLGIPNYFYLFL